MIPNEGATVIGRGIKFRGNISRSTDLLIDGEVEGMIRLSSARVTIRTEGHVHATIVAQDVVVMGHVEGEIRAAGRVELRNAAVVLGDVFATRLSIEEGATLRGSVDPSKAGELVPEPSDVHTPPTGSHA